jgi:phage terminase large subunit-like protein
MSFFAIMMVVSITGFVESRKPLVTFTSKHIKAVLYIYLSNITAKLSKMATEMAAENSCLSTLRVLVKAHKYLTHARQ